VIIHGTNSLTWENGFGGIVPSIIFEGRELEQQAGASRATPLYPPSASGKYTLNGCTVNLENISDFFKITDESVIDTYDSQSGELKKNVGVKVFDGTESFGINTVTHYFYYGASDMKSGNKMAGACSHGVLSTNPNVEGIQFGINNQRIVFWQWQNAYATVADLQTYLAGEYANGTPVTVYYPLDAEATSTITAQALTASRGYNHLYLTSGTAADVTADVKTLDDLGLITDRTFEDVEHVKRLLQRIRSGNVITADLQELATDLKGALNASDLNRICTALNWLGDEWGTAVSSVANFNTGDRVTPTQINNILSDLAALRTRTTDTSLPLPPAKANNYQEYNSIETLIAQIHTAETEWDKIQKLVRAGKARNYYNIGDEFTTVKKIGTDDTIITWRIVGFDHHTPADPLLTHSITLESKYVYSKANGTYASLVFSAPQALYYCAAELPAGTYNFTWNYAVGQMVVGTYQFTLSENVPAGGQIVLGTSSNATAITSCKIRTYATAGGTTAIESNITVSAGSSGTSLGTINMTSSTDENLNCALRIMWGNNNYAQSGARQWLNSAANLGSVWKAQTKFDRPPSWATSSDNAYVGFFNGLDPNFAAVISPAIIPCRTNSVYEIDSIDGASFVKNQVYSIADKVFLLSRPEIYGTWDSTSYKDGTLLEFYDGTTQAEKIKQDLSGSARISWLRSPYPSSAYGERYVNTDGSFYYYYAVGAYAVAPACIIA